MKRLILFLFILLACNPYNPPPAEGFSAAIQAVVSAGSSACTPTYGSELATSANATDDAGGSEANATTGWTNSGCNPFDSIDTAPQTGTYHLTGTADGNAADRFTRNLAGLSASTMYKVSFYARHNGTASSNGEWACYVSAAATYDNQITGLLTKASTTYALFTKYFYFNVRQDNIVCAERNAANDGGLYIDNFSLKAVTSPCLGSELYTSANAAALGANEANATTGFTSTGTSTFESSSTSPADGTYSIHMVANADGGRFYQDVSGLMTVGRKYFVSWKHKYSAGDSFKCGFDPASTLTMSDDTAEFVSGASADTSWIHVGWSFVYDANHAYFGCKEVGASNNADFYIDSLSIKEITNE